VYLLSAKQNETGRREERGPHAVRCKFIQLAWRDQVTSMNGPICMYHLIELLRVAFATDVCSGLCAGLKLKTFDDVAT
jgi:hypothetical protein